MIGLPASAVALGAACLPDLAPFTVADAEPLQESGAFSGCGDGIIASLDDGGDAGESCDPGHLDEAGASADVPGCAACQVTCDGGVLDPRTNHCYFVAGSDTEFDQARDRCRMAGAHLVTFASDREAAFVTTALGPSYLDAGLWVGLSRREDTYASVHDEEPGYPIPPLTCTGCFGLGAMDGGFPPEDASASDAGQAPCLVSHGDGWYQASCRGDALRTTLCEREPVGVHNGNCLGTYCFTVPFTAGEKVYSLFQEPTLPDQAASSCAVLAESLVVLGAAEEREEIAHEIGLELADPSGTPQPIEMWAGITNDAGTWSWEDGGALDPSPWGSSEPATSLAGDRAFLRVSSSTYDVQLAAADQLRKAPRFYLCERKASP